MFYCCGLAWNAFTRKSNEINVKSKGNKVECKYKYMKAQRVRLNIKIFEALLENIAGNVISKHLRKMLTLKSR